VIPTVVDTEVFKPPDVTPKGVTLTMGWIGTHSTFPFLASIFPVLEKLGKKHRFKLKIVGSGRDDVRVTGVEIESIPWSLDREVADFQSFDIGLYPVTVSDSANPEWLRGKSGFKAIQYLAVGVPFVMTPVGVCAEIGEPGRTHFNAETADDWYNSLERLLQDDGLRAQMGHRAREHALENYDLSDHAERLAAVFEEIVGRKRPPGRL
jgi:glycosyltransferase involved in cell wall biosynthesis